jgi:hypothetical protein
MLVPAILLFGGLVVCLGSFVLAAVNLYRAPGNVNEDLIDGLFRRHISAMIGMAIGVALMIAGFVLGLYRIVSPLLFR